MWSELLPFRQHDEDACSRTAVFEEIEFPDDVVPSAKFARCIGKVSDVSGRQRFDLSMPQVG